MPVFTGAEHAAWRRKLVDPRELNDGFDQFRERWDYFVTRRAPGLPLARAFGWFVDELRAYPRDWWAHAALFDYRAGPRLPAVTAPVLVLNPDAPLAAASRAAAAVIPDATVMELPELGGPVLELHADRIAAEIDGFLAPVERAA